MLSAPVRELLRECRRPSLPTRHFQLVVKRKRSLCPWAVPARLSQILLPIKLKLIEWSEDKATVILGGAHEGALDDREVF